MHLQVQRLAALDGAVDDLVIVDASALTALLGRADVWNALDLIERASSRALRQPVYVAAPPSETHPSTPALCPVDFTGTCATRGWSAIVSGEPLSSLAHEALSDLGLTATIVTTSLTDRLHDAWCMGGHVTSMLDVATGRLWMPRDFMGEPGTLTTVEAILRKATRHRQGKEFEHAIAEHLVSGASRPLSTKWRIDPFVDAKRRAEIDKEDYRLLGWRRADVPARMQLSAQLKNFAPPPVTCGYVCADVERGMGSVHLRELHCLLPDGWRRATNDHEAAGLLHAVHQAWPKRWFGPRIIDLLYWMERRSLALPERAVDPAWVAVALDPESPVELVSVSRRLLGLVPAAREWLSDVRREARPPPGLIRLAHELPVLDRKLNARAMADGLQSVIEDDLAATIPVLARIEERGDSLSVPQGFSSWAAFSDALNADLLTHARAVESVLGPVNWVDARATVKAIEQRFPSLPTDEKECPVAEQVERYITQNRRLDVLHRARELDAFYRAAPLSGWINAGALSIHAKSYPQSNGRIGLRSPALQSLNKRSSEGHRIRSALHARPDYKIVAVDYNGFEVRLAADLSGDPFLVAACREPDVYIPIARAIFSTPDPTKSERELTKTLMMGKIYGQTLARVWISLPAIERKDAERLYLALDALLTTFAAFRHAEYTRIAVAFEVRTRGGWRRMLREGGLNKRQRNGFNALVQGLAADIFRRLLRRLDRELRSFGARIVHHAFDEIFVEAIAGTEHDVGRLMIEVMDRVAYEPNALLHHVALRAKDYRVGDSWADLI